MIQELRYSARILAKKPGITDFYSRVEERLQALPGARAAGAIWPLPLGGASTSIPFYRPHQANLATFPNAAYHSATPGSFAALGIPLKKGRFFSEADGRFSTAGPPEEVERRWRSQTFKAVVNESMARRYWPDEDPIGKRFRFGMPEFNGPWVEIVGVVGDIRNLSLEQPARPTFYVFALQNPNSLTFVVRTTQDPESSAQAAKRAVHEVDPAVPVSSIRTMEQVINASVSGRRAAVPLLTGFAFLGLLLSAVDLCHVRRDRCPGPPSCSGGSDHSSAMPVAGPPVGDTEVTGFKGGSRNWVRYLMSKPVEGEENR